MEKKLYLMTRLKREENTLREKKAAAVHLLMKMMMLSS
jgi:hypothetical protein